MLAIAYLRALGDLLIEVGHTGVLHRLDESGWTTDDLESPEDHDHARWLARVSFRYRVNALMKTPAGGEEFADIDVEAVLVARDPSDALRAAFERRTSREVWGTSGRNGPGVAH